MSTATYILRGAIMKLNNLNILFLTKNIPYQIHFATNLTKQL